MIGRRQFCAQSAALLASTGLPAWAAPLGVVHTPRRVERFAGGLPGMPTVDGAGVELLRVIGQPALRNLDPFLMLDRFHSDEAGAYIRGFPDHPHRGFETVTIMLHGRMRHRDSRGNSGLIRDGGIQWMTAGRGIIHSEMPEQNDGLMSGFQLWLNLPAKEKMRSPEYLDVQSDGIRQESLGAGGRARIIAGQLLDQRGVAPARRTDPQLLTAMLEDDAPLRLELPQEHRAFVFVHEGELTIEDTPIGAGRLAVLSAGNVLNLRAQTMRTGFLLAAGRPLGEPIVQRGPFVMTSEAEIAQAYADYQRGVLDR